MKKSTDQSKPTDPKNVTVRTGIKAGSSPLDGLNLDGINVMTYDFLGPPWPR